MLLNIYLVTTAVSWITYIAYNVESLKRLESKGYKFIKQDKPFFMKLAETIFTIIKGCIPVLNILLTISMVGLSDKWFEYVEQKLNEKGIIYIPYKFMSTSESETLLQEETIEPLKVISYVEEERLAEDFPRYAVEVQNEEKTYNGVQTFETNDEYLEYLDMCMSLADEEVTLKREKK